MKLLSWQQRVAPLLLSLTLFSACSLSSKKQVREKKLDVSGIFQKAEQQYGILARHAAHMGSFPRTTDEEGELVGTDEWDWTGGFFPGGLWYIYAHTQREQTKELAITWTEALEKAKDLTNHHDIGFVMYCSYGNAVRFIDDTSLKQAYQNILIHAAKSALERYDAKVGLIKSWNRKESWDGKTVWEYPVIIDNMMNLEMLCYVSEITGDSTFRHVAISHATRTMENHFRSDYSTYHVVDYDPLTGKGLHQQTNQGYADNSTWSRGQAWAIYGFTMMYRETKLPEFLATAIGAADYYINHPNLPDDKIPYWDFNVGEEGYQPAINYLPEVIQGKLRDASAAAIAASALLELSTYTDSEKKRKYSDFAEKTLQSLSAAPYLAEVGENQGFILRHSTGSLPHATEIDKPLIYADYYYLEALRRYQAKQESDVSSSVHK